MDKRETPPLGSTIRDHEVALARGLIGSIPIVGSLIAEIVGELIPNQRLTRVDAYLAYLDSRIAGFETARRAEILESAEQIDLIEAGAFKAARSLTDERRLQIAQVVARGLGEGTQKALDQKRLLELFSDLTDEDLITLLSYWKRNRSDINDWNAFISRHMWLIEPQHVTIFSPVADRERAAIRDAITVKLLGLGLIREDTSLRLKNRDHIALEEQLIETRRSKKLTELGSMILREVGLVEPDPPFEPGRPSAPGPMTHEP